MIPRYEDADVRDIWTDAAKVARWDETELAVIKARVTLGFVSQEQYDAIELALSAHPVDIAWWKQRENETKHDLQAYIDERRRHLPNELQHLFHEDLTSYDTEESALARALLASSALVMSGARDLVDACLVQARKYRYTPFLDRSHGQGAKGKSFGCRFTNWLPDIHEALRALEDAMGAVKRSRISGAIGNYGGNLTPQIERLALEELELTPLIGATQITPRAGHARLAQAFELYVSAVAKIAGDFRLMSRSGMPLCHEPFSKDQTGSSAMPHKRNPVLSEQMEGMLRLIRGYVAAIVAGVQTWEARSIEQSSVERVAWPDLFHVAMRVNKVMSGVLRNMVVYPDNMMRELVESRGTYATDEVKNFLAGLFAKRGISAEVAYRIVQLASFCAMRPYGIWAQLRNWKAADHVDADEMLEQALKAPVAPIVSIKTIIMYGHLTVHPSLRATATEVEEWKRLLIDIFSDPDALAELDNKFSVAYLLKQEHTIYADFGIV